MSLSTTIDKLSTVPEAVAGVENVRGRPGVPLDLDEATATWLTAAGELQRWTVYYATLVVLGAANANQHIEMDVIIVAEWVFREGSNTYKDFALVLAAVQLAYADPATGFCQISAEGIPPIEAPAEPIRIETGEGAYRARFGFRLIDVTST